MFKKTAAALLFASGLLASGAQAATYQNFPLPLSDSDVFSPIVTALGETFIAPTATLQDFSFLLDNFATSGSGNANFVIASWNKNDTVGTTLYSSTISIDGSGLGVSSVGVSGLNLSLNAGSEYVAYLTIDGVKKSINNASLVNGLGGGVIGSGLYSSTFLGDFYNPAANLAYTANFAGAVAAVPEPATYGMLLAGLAMTAGFAARRRRG